MARIYVGVGSNIDREHHVASGLAALEARFGKLSISRIYAAASVGFDGDDFYNLVVGFDSNDDVYAIVDALKLIESDHGRLHDEPKFSSRSLDLDLLTYDDQVLNNGRVSIPREDILKYAFVLRPLAEIAPDALHPVTGVAYRDLWAGFAGTEQKLRDVTGVFQSTRRDT
jgi:2-amino-4-hydroxy-6-hydroxymethyldihydropteridine diphosphokinase